jgi:hypothetical protein
MSLVALMINHMSTARAIIEDGGELVPAWRIATPEGSYLVFSRFNSDKPEQREQALMLVARFMAWKMATSFVLVAETWPSSIETRAGERAILVIGISRNERLGLLQRIEKRDPPRFGPPEWLQSDQIDEAYFGLLPAKAGEITAGEIAELTSIFGEGGKMEAELVS